MSARPASRPRPASARVTRGSTKLSGPRSRPTSAAASRLSSRASDADDAAAGNGQHTLPDHLQERYSFSHKLRDYAQRDLLSSHLRRMGHSGASRDKVEYERRTKLTSWGLLEDDPGMELLRDPMERRRQEAAAGMLMDLTKDPQLKQPGGKSGADDPLEDADDNGGFLFHRMESEAERAMHDLWVAKRQNEIARRKNAAEVKRAVEAWQVNRNRLEEEISRKIESKRRPLMDGALPVAEGLRESFVPVQKPTASFAALKARPRMPSRVEDDEEEEEDGFGGGFANIRPRGEGRPESAPPGVGEEDDGFGFGAHDDAERVEYHPARDGAAGGRGGGASRPLSAHSLAARRRRLETPVAIPKKQPPMRFKTERPLVGPGTIGARTRPASAVAKPQRHQVAAEQKKPKRRSRDGGFASLGGGAAGYISSDTDSAASGSDDAGGAHVAAYLADAKNELDKERAAADMRRRADREEDRRRAAQAAELEALDLTESGPGATAATTAGLEPSQLGLAPPPQPDMGPDTFYPREARAGMSERAQAALSEVDAIKAAFERKGMSVPATLLERALVIRDDKPAGEAVALPAPGVGLGENPLLEMKLKLFGKKKKKKKGRKKGGKKKKKKKKA